MLDGQPSSVVLGLLQLLALQLQSTSEFIAIARPAARAQALRMRADHPICKECIIALVLFQEVLALSALDLLHEHHWLAAVGTMQHCAEDNQCAGLVD